MLTVLTLIVVGLPTLFLAVGFTQCVAFPALVHCIKKIA